MAQFTVPAGPKVYSKRIDNFGGVDFTGTSLTMSEQRSPDACNFTKELAAANVKRPGYERMCTLETGYEQGNGIWTLDGTLIAYSGDKIYAVDETEEAGITATELLSGAPNIRGRGVILEGRLLIFNGERCIWVRRDDDGAMKATFLDEDAYVPITNTLRNAAGTTTTAFESVNLMTNRRINAFTVINSTSTSYVLDSVIADEGAVVARILQEDGSFVEWPEYDADVHLTKTGTLTVTRADGKVKFNSTASGIDTSGINKVFIEFPAANHDNIDFDEMKSRINGCTVAELFGVNGNTDRVFASGNKDKPAYDFWCALYNPTYWPDLNYAQIGGSDAPILGYSRTGTAQLIVHKKTSGGDRATWFRTGQLNEDNEAVFPVYSGGMAEEMLSPGGSAVLEGESLYLSKSGVRGVTQRQQLTVQEYEMPTRSVYINGRLLDEIGLAEKAAAFVYQSKYYLAVGDHMYIADSRFRSYDKKAGGTSYQLEWYYWDHIGAAAMAEYRDALVFLSHDGHVNRFVPGQYWDYDEKTAGNKKPVAMYWITPHLFMDTIGYRKTVRHFAFIPSEENVASFTFGYVKKDVPGELRREERDPLDFATFDFNTLDFTSSSTMQVYASPRSVRNITSLEIFFKSDDDKPSGFHALEIKYTIGGKVRG